MTKKNIPSLADASFPFVTDDYHLIVSSEEFEAYEKKSHQRKWIIIASIVGIFILLGSISASVIPLFLKAHLDEDLHAAPSEHHDTLQNTQKIPELFQVKATYGE